MIDHSRAYEICVSVLAAVEQYYDRVNIGVPARRYVGDGQPAWDAEQLVVYVQRIGSGDVNNEQPGLAVDCFVLRFLELWVEMARPCPSITDDDNEPTIPSPEAIDASAQRVLRDSALLTNAVLTAYKNGDLGACHGLSLLSWEALGPSGGYAGGRLALRIRLTAA